MSVDTASSPEKRISNGAEVAEKQPIADARNKQAVESPTKSNGEPLAEKVPTDSPVRKATPKKDVAKSAKDKGDSAKQVTPKQKTTSERQQSAKTAKTEAGGPMVTPSDSALLLVDTADSGKRERRKVDRFTDRVMLADEAKLRRKSEVLATSGIALGDIERVAHFLARAEPDGLKVLHSIIYSRPGAAKELRPNLRQFRGFAFSEDSAEYKARLNRLKERHVKELKNACFALNLERGGNRDDLVLRIMSFLMKPVDSGRPAPTKALTKRRKSAGKTKKSPGKAAEKNATATDDDDDDEDDEQDELSSEEDKSQEKAKVTPKRPSVAAKSPASSAKKMTTPEVKSKPKAKAGNSDSKKRKATTIESDSTSLSESNAEESRPISAKKACTKSSEAAKAESDADPSDEQLAGAVESILSDADLSTTTIKVVLDHIRLRFPKMEVTPARKSFVRVKVREFIDSNSDVPDVDADDSVAKSGATSSPQKADAVRSAVSTASPEKK